MSALAVFTAKSLRRLLTCKCFFASRFLALTRLFDPFCLRDTRLKLNRADGFIHQPELSFFTFEFGFND